MNLPLASICLYINIMFFNEGMTKNSMQRHATITCPVPHSAIDYLSDVSIPILLPVWPHFKFSLSQKKKNGRYVYGFLCSQWYCGRSLFANETASFFKKWKALLGVPKKTCSEIVAWLIFTICLYNSLIVPTNYQGTARNTCINKKNLHRLVTSLTGRLTRVSPSANPCVKFHWHVLETKVVQVGGTVLILTWEQ